MTTEHSIIAALWPELVCFEKRRKTEIPFLSKQLRRFPNPQVLDACLGSGATSIGLKFTGIDNIISNEKDPNFLAVAQQQSEEYGVFINTVSYDWLEIGDVYSATFDAVLCLGNSLTLVFDAEHRRRILGSFRKSLQPQGKLIIDQRNYSGLFLSDCSGGRYHWSGDVVYCGTTVFDVQPSSITLKEVIMEYTHKPSNNLFKLRMYPFKEGELEEELHASGFKKISSFGDYKPHFDRANVEFLTYVCE